MFPAGKSKQMGKWWTLRHKKRRAGCERSNYYIEQWKETDYWKSASAGNRNAGDKTYTIAGAAREESGVPEEDITLVAEQTGVSKEKAKEALEKNNGILQRQWWAWKNNCLRSPIQKILKFFGLALRLKVRRVNCLIKKQFYAFESCACAFMSTTGALTSITWEFGRRLLRLVNYRRFSEVLLSASASESTVLPEAVSCRKLKAIPRGGCDVRKRRKRGRVKGIIPVNV